MTFDRSTPVPPAGCTLRLVLASGRVCAVAFAPRPRLFPGREDLVCYAVSLDGARCEDYPSEVLADMDDVGLVAVRIVRAAHHGGVVVEVLEGDAPTRAELLAVLARLRGHT